MNGVQSFLFAAALLAAMVGLLFLAGTAYYLTAYLTAASETIARDHLVGLSVGLRYTFGAFAVTAGLALPVRRALPRPLLRLLVAPAIVSGALLLAWEGTWLLLGAPA